MPLERDEAAVMAPRVDVIDLQTCTAVFYIICNANLAVIYQRIATAKFLERY